MTYSVELKKAGRGPRIRFTFNDFIIVQQFARAFSQANECRGIKVSRIEKVGETLLWELKGNKVTEVPPHIPWLDTP